jgi:hypothetical protein
VTPRQRLTLVLGCLTVVAALTVAVVAQTQRLPDCPRASPANTDYFHGVYRSELEARTAVAGWKANTANRAFCNPVIVLTPYVRPFKVAGSLGLESLYTVTISYARP